MGALRENQYIFFYHISLISSQNEKCFSKSCRENQNTYFVFSNFFIKSSLLWNDVEKNRRTGLYTDDNMAHAHCMLDT